MIDQKLIDRINELANKKKTVGLTDEELIEQAELRRIYLEAFRKNFRAQLDNLDIEFVEDLEQN
ncbi:MAG: DUF896 domain-containing protein [Clostridia bacterium]|nr:DUF896 domain-containing protein [Clostridia bacterium]